MQYSDDLLINESTLPVVSRFAERLPGGFFIYHADGNQELIYFNSHLVSMFGCDDAEDFRKHVGNSFKGIVHPGDYSENERSILEQIKNSPENIDHVRYRFIRKDGSVGMMDDYGHFCRSETFGDIYYVFVQDITDQQGVELQHQENVIRIMALEDSFESLYDVDLETGEYEQYVKGQTFSENVRERLVEHSEFFSDVLKNVDLVVYHDDREAFKSVVNREFCRKILEERSSFDTYYRLMVDGKAVWYRMRLVYKDEGKRNLIIGSFNAEKEMEEKLQAEQTRKDLILEMAGTESTYIVYPDTDSFAVIEQNEYLGENYPSYETFTESITRYIDNDVFEPDRRRTREALSLESIVWHLDSEEEYVVRYRDVSSGVPHWYEMRAVRLSDSEILFGFSDRDTEIVEQMLFDRMIENYFGLYYVNLDSGIAQIIKTAHPELTGEAGSYTPYASLLRNIAAASDGEAAEFLTRISDLDYARDFFVDNERGYSVYKSHIYGGNSWVSANAMLLSRHEDGTPAVFAQGFTLLNEDACEKEEAKLELQKTTEKLDKEKLRNDILHDIIHSGKWTFYVNADDEIIRGDVSTEANSIIENDVEADGRSWLDIVHPDDREYASRAFNAAIADHSCSTPYDVNYRMLGRDGVYRWFHSAGRMIRNDDGTGEFFGIHVDITEQMEEQQKRLLGAVPISPDILTKANIGLWAFELDEGQTPRMYVDEAMLGLIGLTEQVPPEETYHAWYDHIDKDSYDLVADAVEKMTSEHAEVQYPWHHPDGRTMIVRCGGVRNPEYTKGIRIEGTHQDVTETIHYDEKAARQQRLELEAAKVREEMLNFISDNEPDVDRFMDFFGRRVIEVTGCDQFIFRNTEGHRIVVNAEGIEDVPQSICAQCAFSSFKSKKYGNKGEVLMNDCAKGCNGVMTNPDCPAKSSFMKKVYSDDRLAGLLSVHYLRDYHEFTENDTDILKTVAAHLGLLLMRIESKKIELEKLKAESASVAKTQFLFNMSHDIRTPMNAILGYTDIGIRHVEDIERSRDSYNKIKNAGGHLLSLINDILEMSRIESGTMEIAENPMDIRYSIEGISQMGSALALPKSIDFRTETGVLRNPYIYSDELHINEVVINLISNAIKYTQNGGKVRLKVDQKGDVSDGIVTYRFEVSDNGIGMSEEFQRHLFEAFSREQTSTVSKQEGAGLGLSIVKKIIDLAGGTISVSSKPKRGSTFTVELPFKVMDAEAIEAFAAENGPAEEISEDVVLEGKKVLLVEDNEMNREIATEILEEAGLYVDSAEDGEIALKAVISKGVGYYDFILMDIQMPVMNGYEATKAIRALPKGESVPIIALSANAFEEDKRKSIENGMNAHVAKPIDVKLLFETMHGLLK